MYPAEFDYYRPKTLAEALTLLRKHKGSRVLAGGHSLLPMMKLRFAEPAHLIDINGIKELKLAQTSIILNLSKSSTIVQLLAPLTR